jgi:uncharacterized damage-inducible protein DinB
MPLYGAADCCRSAAPVRMHEGFVVEACNDDLDGTVERRTAVDALTAEQAHLLVHHVLARVLKNESRKTKLVIAAVPNRSLDYRPDPHARTANELLRHIAAADNFYLKSVIDGVFIPGTVTIPESIKNPVDVAEWYEHTYAKNLAELSELPSDNLVKVLDYRGLLQAPAYTFIQSGVAHTIHHRGQLSTYLRPMGSNVPAIYG